MADLTLPGFEMDCRDWLVLDANDAGYDTDEASDAPVLAVLSTVVIDDDINEASGALTVGLLEEDEPLDTVEVAPGAAASELFDGYAAPGSRRFVIPAPGGQHLALLAEFVVGDDAQGDLGRRVDALMASFRWQTV